jgi:hypothetical protein
MTGLGRERPSAKCGKILNYASGLNVNFESITNMILRAIGTDVINVRTDRKNKRMMRMCDGKDCQALTP